MKSWQAVMHCVQQGEKIRGLRPAELKQTLRGVLPGVVVG